MEYHTDKQFEAVLGNRRGTGQATPEVPPAHELRERAANAQDQVVQARGTRDKAVIAAVEGGIPLAELPCPSVEARRQLGNAGH
ncbi:MAG: hypothetical protein JWM85_2496 [Acidimicrobiaceae bacterium]|nr:hypothetical protein [Acidimicrobiaceae bacterium]